MTLRVSFGQGGSPSQCHLPGTNPTVLPNPLPGLPAPDAITNGPYSPAGTTRPCSAAWSRPRRSAAPTTVLT